MNGSKSTAVDQERMDQIRSEYEQRRIRELERGANLTLEQVFARSIEEEYDERTACAICTV